MFLNALQHTVIYIKILISKINIKDNIIIILFQICDPLRKGMLWGKVHMPFLFSLFISSLITSIYARDLYTERGNQIVPYKSQSRTISARMSVRPFN